MRAIVADAAGFLGSHLCDRLRRDGIEVLGLDNFYTGGRENITHLEGNPDFSFFEHDITRPTGAAVAGPLDVIFNMACPASVAARLPARFPVHPRDQLRRDEEPPRTGAREGGDHTPVLHQRGLRESHDSSAGRNPT